MPNSKEIKAKTKLGEGMENSSQKAMQLESEPLTFTPGCAHTWLRPRPERRPLEPARQGVRSTCGRPALAALLSGSAVPKSASNSVWQRLGSFSRSVWFEKEKTERVF